MSIFTALWTPRVSLLFQVFISSVSVYFGYWYLDWLLNYPGIDSSFRTAAPLKHHCKRCFSTSPTECILVNQHINSTQATCVSRAGGDRTDSPLKFCQV